MNEDDDADTVADEPLACAAAEQGVGREVADAHDRHCRRPQRAVDADDGRRSADCRYAALVVAVDARCPRSAGAAGDQQGRHGDNQREPRRQDHQRPVWPAVRARQANGHAREVTGVVVDEDSAPNQREEREQRRDERSG